jgi:uncharacterized cupredoxin-like copper-binding protein
VRAPHVIALIAPLVAALAVASCGGGSDDGGAPTPTPVAPTDGSITIRAHEFAFEPSAIVVQQDEEVQIVLDNEGDILHNLKIDEELDAEVIDSVSSGPLSGSEGQLFVGADDHDQGTLTFVPMEPGTYTFWCTLEGHRQFGMEGTLTVE